jgi:hypothetical protein
MEPFKIRNPYGTSEPSSDRKPWQISEPRELRNPSCISEPSSTRNPKHVSEPKPPSKPLSLSEREKVRSLVEIYYDIQDVRIRSFNRLREVGEVQGVTPKHLKLLEKEIKDYIDAYVKTQLVYTKFLKGIRGIGPILTGGILSWLDPHKAPHVSSFWKYCGLHVVDGEGVKRKHGVKLDFNLRMRTFTWKIADSFIKHRTPLYRDIYDEVKPREAAKLNHPEVDPKNCPMYIKCRSKGKSCKRHIDYRAKRVMVKRFLADLWACWRALEGLPVSEPYVIGILGHDKQ